MQLKLGALQRIVNEIVDEDKRARELKAEIARVLGPVVITEGRLSDVVAAANDRLDVLDRTGRTNALQWESKATMRWLDHRDPEVRKFVARVVPERHLPKFATDRSPEVRAAAAKRLPISSVREMLRRFPGDDMLRNVLKRRINEAGIKQPEASPLGHDPVDGKGRLGNVARTQEGPELSEAWYKEKALSLMQEYGQNIEYAWEEQAVRRFCSSVKATSGIIVDESRLLKNIRSLIEEREDMVLERDALKETLSWLESKEEQERIDEGAMHEFKEPIDIVRDLLGAGHTRDQYIAAAMKVFNVQESMLPMGIRKYRLGEGNARQSTVPCVGSLPHDMGFRPVDERALDTFCEGWNRSQAQEGEPLRISWSTHPGEVGKISFTCTLR